VEVTGLLNWPADVIVIAVRSEADSLTGRHSYENIVSVAFASTSFKKKLTRSCIQLYLHLLFLTNINIVKKLRALFMRQRILWRYLYRRRLKLLEASDIRVPQAAEFSVPSTRRSPVINVLLFAAP
jgi:hypothetical protein